MKQSILFFLLVTVFSACLNNKDKESNGLHPPSTATAPQPKPLDQKAVDPATLTTVDWIDSVQAMGTHKEGEIIKFSYRFKNTGTKPLVLESVVPSCGCTVATYPKEPIMPGQEGEIGGEFNSQGKPGQQTKHITVTANTLKRYHHLSFTAVITPAKS